MKRLSFATIILLGLTVSCVPTATPQPQVVPTTATVQVPTVTPTLTDMPTSTPTVTLSPTSIPTATNTPTRTPTPTITPTPTQTPIPKFVWKLDFENGFGDAGISNTTQGGTTEVVADPTSSGRGFVQRSTIGGGGNPPKRSYPTS